MQSPWFTKTIYLKPPMMYLPHIKDNDHQIVAVAGFSHMCVFNFCFCFWFGL